MVRKKKREKKGGFFARGSKHHDRRQSAASADALATSSSSSVNAGGGVAGNATTRDRVVSLADVAVASPSPDSAAEGSSSITTTAGAAPQHVRQQQHVQQKPSDASSPVPSASSPQRPVAAAVEPAATAPSSDGVRPHVTAAEASVASSPSSKSSSLPSASGSPPMRPGASTHQQSPPIGSSPSRSVAPQQPRPQPTRNDDEAVRAEYELARPPPPTSSSSSLHSSSHARPPPPIDDDVGMALDDDDNDDVVVGAVYPPYLAGGSLYPVGHDSDGGVAFLPPPAEGGRGFLPSDVASMPQHMLPGYDDGEGAGDGFVPQSVLAAAEALWRISAEDGLRSAPRTLQYLHHAILAESDLRREEYEVEGIRCGLSYDHAETFLCIQGAALKFHARWESMRR